MDGFQVTTATGETVVNLCAGTGDARVSVVADIRGFPIMYVLTDANGVILEATTNPVFDLRSAPPGTYRIYAATFKGFIRNTFGEAIDSAELTSLCWGLSSNYVTILIGSADASTIAISGGGTDTTLCSLDAQSDVIPFEHSATSQSYSFIIVDDLDNILAVTDDEFDFEGAPAGICYAVGISYDGALLATVGLTLQDALAEGCYQLSDNRVQIERVTTDAGTIYTSDSLTQLVICLGDSMSDSTLFITPGRDLSANYRFIITNDQDTILAIQSSPIIDFEGADPGVCRIYGVAFLGDLFANAGDHISAIESDGACLGLTPNYVRVLRTQPVEGALATVSGDTIVNTCPGDSIDDIVNFQIQSGSSPYIFIVTDEFNRVIAVSQSQSINFESAPPGTCYVWRAAYTGMLLLEEGMVLFIDTLSDGCYEISDNAVAIVRKTPEAGGVSTAGNDVFVNVCGGDETQDRYTFEAEYSSDVPFVLVITDENDVVLDILNATDTLDLTNAPSGTCYTYGLSYHGDLLLSAGDTLSMSPIASACYDLSDNSVEFYRTNVDPGVIVSQYGTVAFTCPGDGNPDLLFISRQSDADTSVLIVTDNQGVVLDITADTMINVEGAGEGICQIWNLSFGGELLFEVGDTIVNQDLSSGCFALSDPIIVLRRVPYTDALKTVEGDTTREFCTSDNGDDIVIMDYAPADDFPIQYVITTETGIILAVSSNDTLNFSGASTGICRVYAVAYTGNFISNIGLNIGAVFFSNDCFAISDNYVEVIKSNPVGGQLSDSDGNSIVYVCVNDTVVEVVHFVRTGGSGAAFQYVVTDGDNVILEFPSADSMDFENAPIGICRVWGVAYSGTLLAEVGDTLTQGLLSDECFALTDNFIEVVRDEAEAGMIATVQGDTVVNTITGDTIQDIVTAQANGVSLANGRYVVTDQANNVLIVLNGNIIDFSIVPAAEYRVYYISFTSDLLLSAGDNLFLEPISDGCYDVSDNFIRVVVAESFHQGGDQELTFYLDDEEEVVELGLSVFPNPVIEQLSVTSTAATEKLVVTDVLGRTVFSQINPGSQMEISVGNWQSGMYFVHLIQSGRRVAVQQFMKR